MEDGVDLEGGGRGVAMEVGSSGEWRKKEWEVEKEEAGRVGLY